MNISIHAIPLIFFFINGLIIGLIIGWRSVREQRLADRLMSIFLISTSVLLLPYMLGFMGVDVLWNELLFFPQDTGLLVGPLMYLFIQAQTNSEYRLSRKDSLHFIPFAIYFFYHLIIYIQGKEQVHHWIEQYHAGGLYYLEFYGTLLSNIIYLVLVFLYYRKYLKWIEEETTTQDDLKFPWIQNLLIVITLTVVFVWVFNFMDIFGVELSYEQGFWEFFGLGVAIYYIGLKYLMQRQPLFLSFSAESQTPQKTIKLDEELIQRLTHVMEEEKMYLVPDINLTGLAQKMQVNRSDLSSLINQHHNKNFNQYINTYRVNAFKEAIENKEYENLSLLGIALNVGFSSKATFNRVFKQVEGMTPRQYLSNHKNQ